MTIPEAFARGFTHVIDEGVDRLFYVHAADGEMQGPFESGMEALMQGTSVGSIVMLKEYNAQEVM